MNAALDSEVLAEIFLAMREKREITVTNLSPKIAESRQLQLVPVRVLISSQNGKQNLLALNKTTNRLTAYRIDYLSDVKRGEVYEKFDELRRQQKELEKYTWGVSYNGNTHRLEHVEFTVYVGSGEDYIVHRLYREKRGGRVEKVDDTHYRFVMDLFDSTEIIPWVRTFMCRITQMNFSNRTIENRIKADLREMYRLYGLEQEAEP